ncbi:MAG: ATP-binding protein [Gammaproteobacteria bacterium]|nr:ATP-binding protein [Gammaproteobacteria bacterium]
MKLKTKINFFVFSVLSLLSLSIVLTGYWIISGVIYDLYAKQFSRELKNINQEVIQAYQILEDAGILEIDDYVLAGQKNLLSKLQQYHFGKSGFIIVLDKQGNVLLKPEQPNAVIPVQQFLAKVSSVQQHQGQSVVNQLTYRSGKEKYFSVYTLSPAWDWLIIINISENEIFSQRNKYLYYVSLISLLIFILVLLISIRSTGVMRRKIDQIRIYLERIGKGDYSLRLPAKGSDELADIEKSTNFMIAQIEEEIIHRKETEQELKQAKEEAETANEIKSQFLANISHELRTPLNVILGFSELLMQDRNLAQEQTNTITNIHLSGKHLLTIIHEILDLTKIESNKIDLEEEIFNLNEMLNQIVQTFSLECAHKKLQFNTCFADNLPDKILADRKKLLQIIFNLFSNAIKFTRQGEIIFKVSIHDMNLNFQVSDTGKGMSPEEVEKVFLPFQQAGSRQAQSKGTGLGLAISKKLSELMQGSLTLSSIPGQGSQFQLIIPLKEDIQGLSDDLTIEQTGVLDYKKIINYRRLDHNNSPYQVLIVDDQKMNRLLLLKMLEKVGFKSVTQAENGRQAIEQVLKGQPDLVLLDLKMPEMDGIEALQHIRQLDLPVQPLIFIVSASVTLADKQLCEKYGCDDFVDKPVSLELLCRALFNYLDIEWQMQTDNKE